MLICLCKWFDCLTHWAAPLGRGRNLQVTRLETAARSLGFVFTAQQNTSLFGAITHSVSNQTRQHSFLPRTRSVSIINTNNPIRPTSPGTATIFSWPRRERRRARRCPGLDYPLQTQTLQSGKSIHYGPKQNQTVLFTKKETWFSFSYFCFAPPGVTAAAGRAEDSFLSAVPRLQSIKPDNQNSPLKL